MPDVMWKDAVAHMLGDMMEVEALSVDSSVVKFECPFCRLVPNKDGTLSKRRKRVIHTHSINKGETVVCRVPHCPTPLYGDGEKPKFVMIYL